jgi:mRNA-degrading endonuclease RelE of RelBE toxin-antitoxin system
MVMVRIDDSLIKKLEKKFNKKELKQLKEQFLSLQDNPFQGDLLYSFGGLVLKEKKFKSFRFYFIHSRKILIIKDLEELKDEIIRFIEMSKKNDQQKVIDKLKEMLINLDK